MSTQQFCTFFLDDLFLGIEVCKVQEVIRAQDLTRVPLAPPTIRGLINLRGQIVTAIDLRQRLDMPPRAGVHDPMNVVVRTDEGAVSLLVDEIGDVIEASNDIFERPPETLPVKARELVRGVFKLQGRLLLALDVEQVLTLSAAAAVAGR
jgi:purine-binding chemotaxis protein CheW